jgi:hypothetical protein
VHPREVLGDQRDDLGRREVLVAPYLDAAVVGRW